MSEDKREMTRDELLKILDSFYEKRRAMTSKKAFRLITDEIEAQHRRLRNIGACKRGGRKGEVTMKTRALKVVTVLMIALIVIMGVGKSDTSDAGRTPATRTPCDPVEQTRIDELEARIFGLEEDVARLDLCNRGCVIP